MNLFKGAAPTAAPSFFSPQHPHHQGLSMPWLPPRPFLSPPPPSVFRPPSPSAPACVPLSGFFYAVAPATALIVAAPPPPPSGFFYAVAGATALIVTSPPSLFPPLIAIRVRPCHCSAVAMSLSHCGPSTRYGSPPALVCIIIYDYLCGKIIVPYWRHREPYPHAS